MDRMKKMGLALGAVLMTALVAAEATLAQGAGIDYSILTDGLKTDAQSGIESALPIVAFVLAAVIVVGLIRKFAKAR